MFHLSDLPSGKLYRRMNFLRIRQELAKLINERDYDGLSFWREKKEEKKKRKKKKSKKKKREKK